MKQNLMKPAPKRRSPWTRLLARLFALTLLAAGAHAAAGSGCTAVYVATNPGTSNIEVYNTVTGTIKTVFAPVQGSPSSINGLALHPVTGALYYIDRSVAPTNDLWKYDPNGRTFTKIGAVALPTGAPVNIGATFDNTGGLWLMYSNYTIQNVNAATGAVISTSSISPPATDTAGTPLNSAAGTSGDIAYDTGGQAWVILDARDGATKVNAPYVLKITLSSAAIIVGTNASKLTVSGTALVAGSTNGLSINPVSGVAYATYNLNGSKIGSLTLSTGAITPTGASINATGDLSDCGVLPSPPTLTKSFSASSGASSSAASVTLTLTLGDSNPTLVYLESPLTDALPAGLVIANTPAIGGTCPSAGVTATAGGGAVTYAADQPIPAGGCTITVNLTTSASGTYTNTIAAGSLITSAGSSASATTATYTFSALPNLSFSKTQANLSTSVTATTANIVTLPKHVIEYCLTIGNTGVGAAKTVVLKDALNSNLTAQTGSYGAGQDIRVIVDGGTPTYRTLTAALAGQNLNVTLPNVNPGGTVNVCFQTRVG